jgi:hypothetical protein
VQTGEFVPFRWDIEFNNDNSVGSATDCSNTANDGKIVRASLACRFEMFNGRIWPEVRNGVSQRGADVGITNCGTDGRGSPVATIFQYFNNNYFNNSNYVFPGGRPGRSYVPLNPNFVTRNGITNLGEYKLSLEEVRYQFCQNGRAVTGIPYPRVCQTNFSVTRPYLMQKGATSAASNDDLDDFYNLYGTGILTSVDFDRFDRISLSSYDGGATVRNLTNNFVTKYRNLARTVTQGTEGIYFPTNSVGTIKKVPGRAIWVLSAQRDADTIVIDENFKHDTPFTLIIDQGNLMIVGDITSQGMIIVPNGTLRFEHDTQACSARDIDRGVRQDLYRRPGDEEIHQRQIVNGIFIANEGFVGSRTINDNLGRNWCQEGGLTINGVAIGSNLQALVNNKRSNLNSWFSPRAGFDINSIRRARRDMIYNGAAVLIQNNPDLRNNLPPGADELRSTLEMYRR